MQTQDPTPASQSDDFGSLRNAIPENVPVVDAPRSAPVGAPPQASPQTVPPVSKKQDGSYGEMTSAVISLFMFLRSLSLLRLVGMILVALVVVWFAYLFELLPPLHKYTQPTVTTMQLHGNVAGAGFFKNLGFKLDTEKKTTIHGRGGKIETITLRDSKDRLYRFTDDGWVQITE